MFVPPKYVFSFVISLPPHDVTQHFDMRILRFSLFACVAAVVLTTTGVVAGGADGNDLARVTAQALSEAFALKAQPLSSPSAVFSGADVQVYPPSSYDSNSNTKYPLVVFLHGFCLPDDAQQQYNFTAMRAGAGLDGAAARQTLTQVGLRDFVDDVFYVTPTSPTATRKCALCNLGEDSPNVADRLTTNWINQTLARVAPSFQCPTWDGSDACCAPEKGGTGDDVSFIASVIESVKTKYEIDSDKIYLIGIATGGFMVNRFVCERPELVTAAMTFAGGVWNDQGKCKGASGDEAADGKKKSNVSILNVHGTLDSTVPIGGGVNFAGVPFPSADRTVEILANAFDCERDDVVPNEDKSFTLPAAKDSPTGDVVVDVTHFDNCAGQKDSAVEQWTLNGVDHFWEEETGRAMFEKVMEWLFEKSKND